MHEALENMKQEEQGGTEQVTMAFNIARVNEATGQLMQAKAGYQVRFPRSQAVTCTRAVSNRPPLPVQEVLSNIPSYTDCHLRTACLARNEGNMEAALAAAEAAASAATNSIDVSALLASLHLERRWVFTSSCPVLNMPSRRVMSQCNNDNPHCMTLLPRSTSLLCLLAGSTSALMKSCRS